MVTSAIKNAKKIYPLTEDFVGDHLPDSHKTVTYPANFITAN